MISLNSNHNLFWNENFNKKDLLKKRTFKWFKSWGNFMYFDQTDYLPNDVLTKVDRATMYNSIESISFRSCVNWKFTANSTPA